MGISFLNRFNLLALIGVMLILGGVGISFHEGKPLDEASAFCIAAAVLFLAAIPIVHFTIMKPLFHLKKEVHNFSRECLEEAPHHYGNFEGLTNGLRRIHEKVDKATFRVQELEATINVYASEKHQMETILRSLPIAVLVTDRFNEVLMANDVAQRLFGFDGNSAQGRSVEELLPWQELVNLIKGTSNRKVKVPRRMVELSYQRKAGEGPSEDEEEGEEGSKPSGASPDKRILRVVLSSITDQTDQILGVVTIVQDITKDREIDRMKSEFVANVSHELKAPLSSIKAYTEMLLDGEAGDEESRNEFLGIIEGETNRLSHMIESLLDLSRLEAGVIQLNMERVNLIGMLKSVEDMMRPNAEKRNIALKTDISQYIVPVQGDKDQLNRVMVNLVSNAIKYTPEGGRVDITARLEGDHIRIDVADTGYGIPEEALPRIFDKFYRVKENSKLAQGTGMGLAMVKRILEIHDAEIKVESKVGKGSCFSVFIPAVE